jgi:hypothetical protein
MTGEAGAGTGLCGRALPLPVAVRQILRGAVPVAAAASVR